MLQHSTTSCPGLQCRAVSDAIEPVRKLFRLLDLGRSSSENQESRLKRILGILLMPGHPPSHRQNHPPVPSDQLREGILIPARSEPTKKIAVRTVSRFQGNPEQLAGKSGSSGLH
jgi:hypothetical protein